MAVTSLKYQSQSCSLPLLVVGGEGPPLFGRDWLKHVKLDFGDRSEIFLRSLLALEHNGY